MRPFEDQTSMVSEIIYCAIPVESSSCYSPMSTYMKVVSVILLKKLHNSIFIRIIFIIVLFRSRGRLLVLH